MPAHRHSLAITDLYRSRVRGIRKALERTAAGAWHIAPEEIDATYEAWRLFSAAVMAEAQRQVARSSVAYLQAFVSSELGHGIPTPKFDLGPFTGVSSDGRPLDQALDSPRIGIKAQIGEGIPVPAAIANGRIRALRVIGFGIDQAARGALHRAMEESSHVDGYRRAVHGTCDGCLGLADGSTLPAGTPLEVHPGCECVSEPVVIGAPDRFLRPTGNQIFSALSGVEQDRRFGAEKAKALRDGTIAFADLVGKSPQHEQPDFVTTAPLSDALPDARDGQEGGRDGRGDHNDHRAREGQGG